MTNATSNYQVIIVGAGFAGVAAARRLGKAKIPTLLIDRNNYSQFHPCSIRWPARSSRRVT